MSLQQKCWSFVQWNAINATTALGHKILVVITRWSHYWGLQNNKMTQWFLRLVWKNVAVITRWSYKLDVGKAGLHCNYEIYVTTRHHMVIFTVVKERQSPAFWLIWMASGLMRTENFLYKMWIMNNLPTSETISELEVTTIVCGSSKDNCQIVWKTLTFETRPSVKPFLWQWVSFSYQWLYT